MVIVSNEILQNKEKPILFHIDEYVIEKPHRKKGKKRSKKRPQSATTTHTDSVRIKI